ncbi:unnamed protein product [Hanseniaspora opuntiae]
MNLNMLSIVLLTCLLPLINAKTINVAIDYENTLDVYYNFKTNSSITVTPVSTGLEINVLDQGFYSNTSVCQILSDGMIIVNVDKSSSNQLITWNSQDVYHLVNPNSKSELSYDSVLLQGLAQYTSSIHSRNSTFTGLNKQNNTIAIVAQALSTTTTGSSFYTSYNTSVYTEVETLKSCMNHAMGGCSVVTLTDVVSNGVTYTGKSVITSVYQSEYETTLLQPITTQASSTKKLNNETTGTSSYTSIKTSVATNESLQTSMEAISTIKSKTTETSNTSLSSSKATLVQQVQTSSNTTLLQQVQTSSRTTLLQQVPTSSNTTTISLNTLFDGAANKIHSLTRLLSIGLIANLLL